MINNRRSFFKRFGLGVASGTLLPEILFSNNIPEFKPALSNSYDTLNFDVIVVGAGPGGISAAIAAARNGAKVVLLEEDSVPGGAPVDMFVTFMCGGPRVGLFKQLVQELNRDYPVGGIPCDTFGEAGSDGKNHWWLPSSFSIVYQKMLAKEQNITLMFGTMVFNAIVREQGNRNIVQGVRVIRNGRFQEIKAPVTIDATGNGLIAATAGCKVLYGSEAKSDFGESFGLEVSDGKVQPCTQMYISQRVRKDAIFPIEKFGSGVLEDNNRRWVQEQDRTEFYRNNTGIFLHWGVSAYCADTTDPVQIAATKMNVVKSQEHHVRILQDAGFAVHLAPKIGVREARRVQGEYVITVDDLFKGVQPDDKIADADYAIDAWGWKIPAEIKQSVKPYGIPYRSLIPLNMEGLLTAGRIISGTRLAMSSYRVQPICSAIGEAAGTAAAMAALNKTKVRDINIRQLQSRLDQAGLFDAFKDKPHQ
ncbi:MAG: FAD-dependent oxidoreductase [Mangrovibacterium sp.]